ncbi:DUF6670 family protein [Acinetobacter sp. ANC 3882]|uniref:DUF6670 family protein n=1 Tax=Acinetobacter sp. ANC 3882 TaxID=2923423 RepID=UPI001F4AB64C|nr:DUF6670 family protein [Acinetobacter sp. ANC 3882]MCH7315350.1 hypothetical protein [Acinetobacter sp. ANC 3882]
MFNQWPAFMGFIKQMHKAIDHPTIRSKRSFLQEYAWQPQHRAQQKGWSRYGIIIPDLPDPHQFFSFLSIVSSAESEVVELDPLLQTHLGKNAMIVTGTAAKMARHSQSHLIPQNYQSAEANPFLQFGKDVSIAGQYPYYRVVIRQAEFKLDIQLKNTDKVSWFIQMPMYDHFSLLSHYEGYFRYQGGIQKISGLCTFEYAFCKSLNDSSSIAERKIPLDFSTYHIVSLDEQTQLLLNETHFNGEKMVNKAFLRNIEGENQALDAEFEILSYQSRLAIAEDGRPLKLPFKFRWLVKNKRGDAEIIIRGEVDTTMLYGISNGYVGGYGYEGFYKGREIEGRGYMEYIDRRVG